MTRLSAFLCDETGAATVDWVVLTAGVGALSLMIFTVVSPKVKTLTNKIATQMDESTAVLASDNANP